MTVLQSILTALFCMVMVFAVLIMLWGVIRLFSFAISKIEKTPSGDGVEDRR